MVLPTVINLLSALVSGLLGAAATSWLWYSYNRRQLAAASNRNNPLAGDAAVRLCKLQTQPTMEFAVRLNELMTQVAFDVGEHSCQVQEFNDELTASQSPDATKILDVMVRLVEANQHMQEKLTSTEQKLREQTDRMQTLLAESRTDGLTLLANRRAFDDELVKRFAEFRRQGTAFSLAVMDVDRFKNFNDLNGPRAGDDVLRNLAKVLRRTMPETALVARYGGDEFAILHPGENPADACNSAQRVCETIENYPFVHEGKAFRVTMSFGVAEMLDSETAAETFKRAHSAMYASKEAGRNCVHFHDGTLLRRIGAVPESVLLSADTHMAGQSESYERKDDVEVEPAQDAESESRTEGVVELAMPFDLPGRTHFCQQVRNRMAEWKRGGPSFSVALITASQSGPGGGDDDQRALELASRTTARFLLATVREMDVMGSYAADCFALLMPAAGLADAVRVADRQLEVLLQHISLASGRQPAFKLSVGVVQAIAADDVTSLLKRAELAMDAADRRGGNRVYCHDGERIVPGGTLLEMEATGSRA